MANLNLAYTKDIFGGTIPIGTSPENLSLGANVGRLKQVFLEALDSFYIDPIVGMYKTNADTIPACYRLQKNTSWYELARALNADSINSYFTYYTEIKLGLGTAQPFKLSLGVFSGTSTSDVYRSVRMVIEAVVAGSIQVHYEYYDPTQQNGFVSTPARSVDLTLSGAPYLFNVRIYTTITGIAFEFLDEYSYYTDTARLGFFYEISDYDPAISGNQMFMIWHSRTAGDFPAIRSIGWGYVLPTQAPLSLREALFTNGEIISVNTLTTTDDFTLFTFPTPGRIESAYGTLIPDKITVTCGGYGLPFIMYPSGVKTIALAKTIGGFTNKSRETINYKQPISLLMPPGISARAAVFYKETK